MSVPSEHRCLGVSDESKRYYGLVERTVAALLLVLERHPRVQSVQRHGCSLLYRVLDEQLDYTPRVVVGGWHPGRAQCDCDQPCTMDSVSCFHAPPHTKRQLPLAHPWHPRRLWVRGCLGNSVRPQESPGSFNCWTSCCYTLLSHLAKHIRREDAPGLVRDVCSRLLQYAQNDSLWRGAPAGGACKVLSQLLRTHPGLADDAELFPIVFPAVRETSRVVL